MLTANAGTGEAKSRKSWKNANAAYTGGSFSGKASYYGPGFAGRKTASGARFAPMGMTAAHRTLPFGTRLKVTHRGRSVMVTINDRGPFIRGRVLDLSQGAARASASAASAMSRRKSRAVATLSPRRTETTRRSSFRKGWPAPAVRPFSLYAIENSADRRRPRA